MTESGTKPANRSRGRYAYLAAFVLSSGALSAIELTYTWYDPIPGPEGGPRYSMLGLRRGALMLGNQELGPAGLKFSLSPGFFPIPFAIVAGPEGGAVVVAVWFAVALLLGVVAAADMALRRRATRLRRG